MKERNMAKDPLGAFLASEGINFSKEVKLARLGSRYLLEVVCLLDFAKISETIDSTAMRYQWMSEEPQRSDPTATPE